MSELTEMIDVFFNRRPARRAAAEEMTEALRLLKGMHDKFHCKDCVCQVADFLDLHKPRKATR